MIPLCNFENKKDAMNYYTSKNILAPEEAKEFVNENWDKTRRK